MYAEYNENMRDLLPYLQEETCLTEIDSNEHDMETCDPESIRPKIICVRAGNSDEAVREAENIKEGLCQQGFEIIRVKELVELA